jgi:hypothetical protein
VNRRSSWAVGAPRRRNRAIAAILLHVGTAVWAVVRLRRRPEAGVVARKWEWAALIAVNLVAGTFWRGSRLAAPSPAV